jgi:Na+:H+ antiporter, NhaC family
VFNLSPIVLLPAGAVLLLALLRVPVKLAMGVSIGLGVAIAHSLQQYPLLTLIRFSLVGYQLNESAAPGLQAIMVGGGLLPMAKATLVVFLSTAFAGIFAGTRSLSFVDSWLKHIRTQHQLKRATVLIAIVANLFGCTQTIAILLTGQIMRPHYKSLYKSPDKSPNKTYCSTETNQSAQADIQANTQLALALEDTAVVIAPCIPWNIAGLIPATVLMVGPGFIPYMIYLLLLPLATVLSPKRSHRF